ncbi:hypothetical protein D9613_010072 [Agrocybe pediades]|uniref:Uncharacterized protein n=1 Tax=Agrocybe pediades TaxID=84607 RepID=A0A8H4VQF1_9AGAR|nr:hypothetical protein D9613_010072 [Agrocybe pediades]
MANTLVRWCIILINLKVAKPPLCRLGETARPPPMLLQYTIPSSSAIKSFSEVVAARHPHCVKQLVTNLKSFQPTTAYSTTPSDIQELEVSIYELENIMNSVVNYYNSKIDYAETQIHAFHV